MRKILTSILIAVCLAVNAQGYFRLQLGAAGSNGPEEFYHFDRFPERFPTPTNFSGRLGGGWIIETEAGYRFSKNVEAGISYVRHGYNYFAAIDYAETDSGDGITMTRVGVLNASDRAGIFGYFFIGKKKTQPFIMGGIQVLVDPDFRKAYTIDTNRHGPNGRRFGTYYELYTGGLSVGYSIGGGVAMNRDSNWSFNIKGKFTFQSWTPKRMDHSVVYNGYKREEDLALDNPGIKVMMNSFGVTVGVTYSFGDYTEVMKEPTVEEHP